MIPMPILTFIFTKVTTAIFQYLATKMKAEQATHKMAMEKAMQVAKERKDLNENTNPVFQFTRRYLAISAWTIYWGLKLLIALGLVAVGVNYGQEITTTYGFFIFSWSKTEMVFQSIPGIPITSFDYHMLAAITGSYFGSSNIRNT